MAEPNLNVEFSAVTDEKGKFRRLAKLLGLADADHARGKCEHLWLACTRRGETDLPQWLVEEILGEGGPAALVDAELARWAGGRGDSKTRRLRISGARKHCTWLASKSEQSSNAGKSNARTANRVGGKFAPKPTIENHPSDPSSDPVPEDQNSLPHAIPPTLPEPEPTPVPAVSPPAPAPAREDIARTQPAIPGPLVTTPAEIAADLAFNADDPRARGRLAEAIWRRVSDAAITVAAELRLPAPLPFPVIGPSTRRRGFVELCDRIREEGELASAACDRVVGNLIAQARTKRSVEWLAEKAFGDKAWLNARNGVDPSASAAAMARIREAGGPRDGFGRLLPSMPTPPKFKPEPRLERSTEDLAAMLAMADAVAADPTRGADVASMPTAELVKRFGDLDGARAPPASAGPHDDTPTDEPRRKAAKWTL
jgi:hypothetical protein